MPDINLPTTTERCICGRLPVASKVRGGGWVLTCPAWVTCDNAPTGGCYPTLPEAVEEWNYTIRRLRKKEAKK